MLLVLIEAAELFATVFGAAAAHFAGPMPAWMALHVPSLSFLGEAKLLNFDSFSDWAGLRTAYRQTDRQTNFLVGVELGSSTMIN